MKKTKIVSTIGPASESEEMLESLFNNGLNVCRLNFSHGNHEEHQMRIDRIKKVRAKLGLSIAIMLDTKGPEIRIKNFKSGGFYLEENSKFILTGREVEGDETIVSISYENLANDVKVGDKILIDDGLVELVIDKIEDKDIYCTALNGGEIKNHKGVNVPHVKISLPAVTNKDVDDIIFGIKNDIDFIAASFVRKREDVLEIRKILEDNNAEKIEIISKIENHEGVQNIDEILEVSDGIMVARGDLGVEIEAEEIPLIQKSLIKKANSVGKNVITATQMLDSMIRNPRPTRAEVTDIANAILDGSGAIMLSGETAAGKYPLESLKTMNRIAIRTEESLDYAELLRSRISIAEISTTNAIGKAVCSTALDLQANAIITATSSGYTSNAISKFRPKAIIVAVTTEEKVMRKLSLVWGVYPVISPYGNSTDDVIEMSIKAALDSKLVKGGDLVIITAGIPVGVTGTTNLIKVHTIGKTLAVGVGIGSKTVFGDICNAASIDEIKDKFKTGDIIVSYDIDNEMVPYVKRASAIIVEEGGLTSTAAIVGLTLGIPTIVGVNNATTILKHGMQVTLDATTGQIYEGEARVV